MEHWVDRHGAVGDGTADDGPAIRAAIATAAAEQTYGESVVRFRPGRYRIRPADGADHALPIVGASGITLRGEPGTEIVVGDVSSGCLLLKDVTSCTVEQIVVDYDPLPFTQGVVVGLDERASSLDVRLDAGYPSFTEEYWKFHTDEKYRTSFGAVFDRELRQSKPGLSDAMFVETCEQISERTFRLGSVYPRVAGIDTGDLFIYAHRRIECALLAQNATDLHVRDVEMQASRSLAFGLVECAGEVTIERCSVRIRPGTDRLLSTNGDAVHAQGCTAAIRVEDCRFASMFDDGANVYAGPNIIVGGDGSRLSLSGGTTVDVDDDLEVYDTVGGGLKGVVRVVAHDLGPDGTREVRVEPAVADLRTGTAAEAHDVAVNLTRSAPGFVLRGTTTERHRGRGILVKSPGALIENNTFRRVSGTAIDARNEPDWPEGAHPHGLTIRGNTIESVGMSYPSPAIHVAACKHGYRDSDVIALHDVLVADNVIDDWHGSAIRVASAERVQLVGNTLRPGARRAPDLVGESKWWGLDLDGQAGVVIEHSRSVEVRGLRVLPGGPAQPDAAVRIGSSVESGEAGVVLSGIEVPDGTVPVRDDRA